MRLPVPVPDLPAELEALLAQIPAGQATTYGDLAAALGSRRAARWVGEYLAGHVHAAQCPCHRVVRSTGEPGLYSTGTSADKLDRLDHEQVPIENGRVVLDACRFNDFRSDQPLMNLLAWQESLPARNRLRALRRNPRTIGGMDVSYRQSTAVAACVILEAGSLETVWQATVQIETHFPYIPGFLAFREIPALLLVWEQVLAESMRPDLMLIDGNGILHPQRAGIATHFGILADVPTIGISKKLLCGRLEPGSITPDCPRSITDNDELLGMAVAGDARSRPVYVSPGYGIQASAALKMVQKLFAGHRLPEPTYRADRISRAVARQY